MRTICQCACAALFFGVAGCSIHPIPFDVPGYNTVDIVRQIRCEAALAIEKYIVVGLRGNDAELRRYRKAQMVFNYTFAITESNDLGASADFKLPFTSSTFTLGLGASAEKERSGTRQFTVTDSFPETLEEIFKVIHVKGSDGKMYPALSRRSACAREASGENWIYPITGKIGLDETIRTFVELNSLNLLDPKAKDYEFPLSPAQTPAVTQKPAPVPPQALPDLAENFVTSAKPKRGEWESFAALKKGEKKEKKEKKKDTKTEDFSDELEFTTTFKATANPKIELKSAGSGFRLTGAEAAVSGQRTDKHKVIITLAFPREGESAEETRDRAREAAATRLELSTQESIAKAFSKR